MTSNPPEVPRVLADISSKEAAAPAEEATDIEWWIYPEWLDHDSASDGPNHPGQVMWLLIIALIIQFAGMALAFSLFSS